MEFLIQRLSLAVASAIQQNCSILSNKSLGDLITIISAKQSLFAIQHFGQIQRKIKIKTDQEEKTLPSWIFPKEGGYLKCKNMDLISFKPNYYRCMGLISKTTTKWWKRRLSQAMAIECVTDWSFGMHHQLDPGEPSPCLLSLTSMTEINIWWNCWKWRRLTGEELFYPKVVWYQTSTHISQFVTLRKQLSSVMG